MKPDSITVVLIKRVAASLAVITYLKVSLAENTLIWLLRLQTEYMSRELLKAALGQGLCDIAH